MEGWIIVPDVILLRIFAYLPISDRLSASITCKRWREVLFHPNNWHSAKFDFSKDNLLRETFLTRKTAHFIDTCIIVLPNRRDSTKSRQAQKNLVKRDGAIKKLMQKLCFNGKLLALTFRQTSTTYEERADSCEHNCELREQMLFAGSECDPYAVTLEKPSGITSYLIKICSNANNLTHLALGCFSALTNRRSHILDTLNKHHRHSVKSLHVSYIGKSDDVLDINQLLLFKNLQHLSLNMRDLSDALLTGLVEGGRVQLKTLIINLTAHEMGKNHIKSRTWEAIRQSCPELSLTLNLIHCPEAIDDLPMIVCPAMPLSHLRILFCDAFSVSGLLHVSRYQAKYLQSLHIIDSMLEGPLCYDIHQNEQDPFVMLAWRCNLLNSISIIGINLQVHEILAVVRLRGRRLEKFEVLDDCISPYSEITDLEFEEDSISYENFCEEVSSCIGRQWQPLTADDVHPCIYGYEKDQSSAYLPYLMDDQKFRN